MYGDIFGKIYYLLVENQKRAGATTCFPLLILPIYFCSYSQIIPVFTFKACVGRKLDD